MQEDAYEPEVGIDEDGLGRSFAHVFLYPCTAAALGRIALLSGLLLALTGYQSMLVSLLGPAASYLFYCLMFLNILAGADFFFYLADCVQSSADGAVRAKDELFSFPTELRDIVEDFAKLVFPYLVCFLPSMLYTAVTERQDGIYWLLLGAGTFYFPMFLLAVVLFDSGPGFNPLLHAASIVSAFFAYGLLVLQCLLIVGLFLLIAFLFDRSPLTAFLILPLEMYFMILFAHLLGRFYYRNEDKLRWEV
jgi:hypothetical protein